MVKEKVLPSVMGFFHVDGFVPAWKQATKFMGKDGRLGTLPDVIEARLATQPGEVPWEKYFTTLSAEYLGLSRGGTKILIVAHGIGPMSTLDGILKAYSHEFKDKERNRRGGRITREAFLDLESGKFGNVEIVEFDPLMKRYAYPFLEHLKASQAINEPLLLARFGPRGREYINRHMRVAREYHEEEGHGEVLNPYILQMGGASNCSYRFFDRQCDGDSAFAHLLSIGQLVNSHLSGPEYPRYPNLTCDVNCHEWWNGVRLLGIRKGAKLNSVHGGADAYGLLRTFWKQLMVPSRESVDLGMPHLIPVGDQWFTDYPKKGASMDNWEPQFRVTSKQDVGTPVTFRTAIGGYHGFFKYDVREIQVIAPAGASAYSFTDEPECVWEDGDPKFHIRTVQFHQVTVDLSQRLMRVSELVANYDLLMSLVGQEK